MCPPGSRRFDVARHVLSPVPGQKLIDEFLKPRFLPTIRRTQFNYPVDILGKWHGTKYRFIQRYRSGFPGEFPRRRALRAPTGAAATASTFSGVAPGEWFCLHRSLSLAEAIDTLRSEGLFHPSEHRKFSLPAVLAKW